jgi:hypothetical protein
MYRCGDCNHLFESPTTIGEDDSETDVSPCCLSDEYSSVREESEDTRPFNLDELREIAGEE